MPYFTADCKQNYFFTPDTGGLKDIAFGIRFYFYVNIEKTQKMIPAGAEDMRFDNPQKNTKHRYTILLKNNRSVFNSRKQVIHME